MNKEYKTLKKLYDNFGIVKTSEMTTIPINSICEILGIDFLTFEDIPFNAFHDGVHGSIMFDNGYGASVVRHSFSYGGKSGLYELAVLDKNGDLIYDTPITDDVIGYLTPEEVTEVLIKIQDLK